MSYFKAARVALFSAALSRVVEGEQVDTEHRQESTPVPSTQVDLSNYPKSASTDFFASQRFSPSRHGYTSMNWTVGCLCDVARTPLNCASSGLSAEDTCWNDVEDWIDSVCHDSNAVNRDIMPICVAGCTTTHLVGVGCGPTKGSVRRNCFYKIAQLDSELEDPKLPSMVDYCKKDSGCWHNIRPGPSYEEWKASICTNGVGTAYN